MTCGTYVTEMRCVRSVIGSTPGFARLFFDMQVCVPRASVRSGCALQTVATKACFLHAIPAVAKALANEGADATTVVLGTRRA